MSSYGQMGDIEDAIRYARNKYSGDIDKQAQFFKNCIEIIKREFGDEVDVVRFDVGDHTFVVTGFPSSGKAYFWWEMYDTFNLVSVGLERADSDKTNGILLFCSDSNIKDPIIVSMFK